MSDSAPTAATTEERVLIEGVAFDIDGTLYPNAAMYLSAIPLAIAHPRLMAAFGQVRKEIRKIRPIVNFRSMQAQMLGEKLGIEPERADALIRRHVYENWEQMLLRIPLYPHVRELIGSLRLRGLKLGVVSDFPVERKLGYLGVEGLWDCAFSSEDIGYLKPNPEPFAHMVQCLELPPSRILYVGNSYHYDVEGARKVGMKTAHLTRTPHPESEADITFRDFKTLEEWVFENIV